MTLGRNSELFTSIADAPEQALSRAAQQTLAEEVLRRFIELVLFARCGSGTWDQTAELSHFAVFLPWDEEGEWWVRTNDESHFWTAPRATRDFAAGEHLRPHDLHVEAVADIPPDVNRFITGVWNGNSWDLQLQLNHADPERLTHLEAGLEFASVAAACLERDQLRAFHENAFHAVEHLAKAELLSYAAAAPEICESRTHARLRSAYQLWACLGNTEQRFARLLQALDEGRSAATYGAGLSSAHKVTAREQHLILEDMVIWVRHVVGSGGLRTIRLYVTHDTAAGELVSHNAAGIRPPRH